MASRTSAILITLVLALALIGAGCATQQSTPPSEQAKPKTAGEPTKASPLVVDKEAKTIKVYAEVNRKYVTEPTRHGVVWEGGSNGDKAIFKAFAPVMDIYDALIELGAKPGDNVKATSPKGTKAEGTQLQYTVSWDGNSYDINDLVASTGKLGGKPLLPKFGGNKAFQNEKKTGCIFCLDTCAAGITSNANVGWMSFDSGLVKFTGIGDKLPSDGAGVTVTIQPVGI